MLPRGDDSGIGQSGYGLSYGETLFTLYPPRVLDRYTAVNIGLRWLVTTVLDYGASPVSVTEHRNSPMPLTSGFFTSAMPIPRKKVASPTKSAPDFAINARTRDETVIEICEQIGAGRSLAAVCAAMKTPTTRTFWLWLAQSEEHLKLYEAGLRARAECHAEEIAAIADTRPPLVDGKMDSAYVAWQKNRIDARKWTASKLLPKKYGDRTVLAGDPEAPLIAPTIIIGGPDEEGDAAPAQ